MNIHQAIKIRRSVRAYKDKRVPEKSLNKVLEAARFAPSTKNLQPWKFVVVKDLETRKKLAEAATGQNFIAQAPVVIVAVALNPDYIMRCGVPAYAINLAIAVDHMTLAAVEEGLGTCWIGAFSQERVRRILGIPNKYKVVALLPLGFPADKPEPKVRKNLEDIVCFEKFSK